MMLNEASASRRRTVRAVLSVLGRKKRQTVTNTNLGAAAAWDGLAVACRLIATGCDLAADHAAFMADQLRGPPAPH